MIVAVDFDGILCEDAYPQIGRPQYSVISAVRQLMDAGFEVILWTSRVEDKLQEAVSWCENYGLHFTSVNENSFTNISKYGTNPRKVFADIYIDDHNLLYLKEQRVFNRPVTATIVSEIEFIIKNFRKED